jgi:hypothetical protein
MTRHSFHSPGLRRSVRLRSISRKWTHGFVVRREKCIGDVRALAPELMATGTLLLLKVDLPPSATSLSVLRMESHQTSVEEALQPRR